MPSGEKGVSEELQHKNSLVLKRFGDPVDIFHALSSLLCFSPCDPPHLAENPSSHTVYILYIYLTHTHTHTHTHTQAS